MELHQQGVPLDHNTTTHIADSKSLFNLNGNNRGRPSTAKIITFCPQPKSIVSQILNEIKTMRYNKEATNSAKISDCSPIQLGLENHFSESNVTEVLDYTYMPSVKPGEDFNTLNTTNDNCNNEGESWNMGKIKRKSNKRKKKINRLCKSECNNKGQLQDHLSTPEDSCFTCSYAECTYSTKIMSNLLKHKRIHTNERPYLCDKCTFRSNFVNSLKAHKRIHTSERPYCCELCGHRCNSISNLKKHNFHKHKNASKIIK